MTSPRLAFARVGRSAEALAEAKGTIGPNLRQGVRRPKSLIDEVFGEDDFKSEIASSGRLGAGLESFSPSLSRLLKSPVV
jgi:hypothetical protein